MNSGSPIFVAIDTVDVEKAMRLADQVRDSAGGLKLGLEYFCANGPGGVHALARTGLPIFLDLKLHDIPNTVAGALKALAPLAPSIVTVHAAGGREMMEKARAAAPAETRLVAVTVLTSLDDRDLEAVGVNDGSPAQVARLAGLARSAGLQGIVCSGQEVAAARKSWSDGLFVVPGVRAADSEAGDQKRVVTPRDAMRAGASLLVIGRPITQAADPGEAARILRDSI